MAEVYIKIILIYKFIINSIILIKQLLTSNSFITLPESGRLVPIKPSLDGKPAIWMKAS